jgi:hypothetical protein
LTVPVVVSTALSMNASRRWPRTHPSSQSGLLRLWYALPSQLDCTEVLLRNREVQINRADLIDDDQRIGVVGFTMLPSWIMIFRFAR